jgi:hypothetical protein
VGLNMQIWRAGDTLVPLVQGGTPTEKRLEELLESNPTLLGLPLLVIGRQVRTDLGRIVDLLALDSEGTVHVLELKRDRTPREAVAQALEYAAWAAMLDQEEVRAIHADYRPDTELEVRATELFGAMPDEVSELHRITVVASSIDPHSQRVVEYLQGAGVPVNVVLFNYFADGDREYLARAWVVDEAEAAPAARDAGSRKREPWNGQDWYVSFGHEPGIRDWEDARKFGFVAAGGGEWYSRTLSSLTPGARVFACIPKTGYVGVGEVVGQAASVDDASLAGPDGTPVPFRSLPLAASYEHSNGEAEWVVPVRWLTTVPAAQGVWEKGLFANQNSACKLRNRFTLDRLHEVFGLDAEG